MIFLGFDTSNYTTSVACVDGDNTINLRQLLDVKLGERGLRQSEALFQHIKALPSIYNELSKKTDIKNCLAVGVSTRPRNVENSYMPVFLAGEGYAKICADTLGVPLYSFSHQDGHIMAGIMSANAPTLLEKQFISVHLSGGTCEVLLTKYNGYDFDLEIIGGSKDISAGQLIDRIGVKMGLGFPSGKELEKIAKTTDVSVKLPVNTKDGYINFSGIETKAISLLEKEDNKSLALGVFESVAFALEKVLKFLSLKYEINDILIVGGVISNSIIKEILKSKLTQNLYFAPPELSCDNALGIAQLTKLFYIKNNS